MKRLFITLLLCLLCLPSFAAGESGFSFIPTGTIWMYGGTTAPDGWSLCDGTIASDTAIPALAAKLSKRYNLPGDPTDSTRRPNFQGVFPKGHGTQTIGGVTYANASGTPQADKMQAHSHTVRHNYSGGSDLYMYDGSGGTQNSIEIPNGSTSRGTIEATTISSGRSGTITEPANVGVNFIIKN